MSDKEPSKVGQVLVAGLRGDVRGSTPVIMGDGVPPIEPRDLEGPIQGAVRPERPAEVEGQVARLAVMFLENHPDRPAGIVVSKERDCERVAVVYPEREGFPGGAERGGIGNGGPAQPCFAMPLGNSKLALLGCPRSRLRYGIYSWPPAGDWVALDALEAHASLDGTLRVEPGRSADKMYYALVTPFLFYSGFGVRLALRVSARLSGEEPRTLLDNPGRARPDARPAMRMISELINIRNHPQDEIRRITARLVRQANDEVASSCGFAATAAFLVSLARPAANSRLAICDLCGEVYEKTSSKRSGYCSGPSPDDPDVPCCIAGPKIRETYSFTKVDDLKCHVLGELGVNASLACDREELLKRIAQDLDCIRADSRQHANGRHPATALKDIYLYLERQRDLYLV